MLTLRKKPVISEEIQERRLIESLENLSKYEYKAIPDFSWWLCLQNSKINELMCDALSAIDEGISEFYDNES